MFFLKSAVLQRTIVINIHKIFDYEHDYDYEHDFDGADSCFVLVLVLVSRNRDDYPKTKPH